MFAKIPDHILQQIRDRIGIVEVVGKYVELKRAGRTYKGLCPFHKEAQPSFTVSDERGFYHCFGCSAHGDIFRFLQEMENLTFMEAVEQLAQAAGVELPDVKRLGEEERRRLTENDRLYEANRAAQEFFQKELLRQPKTSVVVEYLKKRGVSREMEERFRLGFAPESWNALADALRKKGLSTHTLEKAGLIVPGGREGHYDRFRNRLMFPIVMQHDRIVGFGGRTLSADEPAKYINSPETPVFIKSNCLYGYHAARGEISRLDRAIMVEGNLDVVAMHQFGFPETVATLGTALTENHIKFLKRMTKNLILIYDGDEAGRKAMFRSLDLFLKESVNARAVVLPPNHDPDSFVRAEGAEAMKELLAKSRYLFDIWLEQQYSAFSNSGPRGTSECLNVVVPLDRKSVV